MKLSFPPALKWTGYLLPLLTGSGSETSSNFCQESEGQSYLT